MRVKVTVKCMIDSSAPAGKIRSLFCEIADQDRDCWKGLNPLSETNFNNLLDMVAQEAFEIGRKYETEQMKGSS